jgi:succinate dehydrogenase / fumarate reductase cytochrome b subunit
MSTSNKPASGGYQTDQPRFDRPLSPHLQIYRWQITMTTSILHRFSGVILSVGSLVLAWWLTAVAIGGDYHAWVAGILGSPVGLFFLFGWSLAFFYHLGNGIRHLLWDAGWGFDLKTMYVTGYSVFIFTVVATALTWWCALAGMGGGA